MRYRGVSALRSCTHWAESEGRAGSTCPLTGQAPGRGARSAGTAAVDEDAIEQLVADGDLVRDGDWVYRTPTWELERELGERVLTMLGDGDDGTGKLGAVGDEVLNGGELTLTAEQEAGVRRAFEHRLSVITGGPGIGEDGLQGSGRSPSSPSGQGAKGRKLVAPTGRARHGV